MPLPTLYSKDSTDNLLAAKLDLAGGTMTGGLTLSATGIIFSDATTLTTAPAGSALAADQLTAGVVTANPAAGPTTAGDVLQYDGTDLIWAAGGGGVAWGAITGTVTDQTDLTTYLSGAYYPLSGNPSGFLTSAPAKTVNAQSSNYTLVSSDANNIVYMASSTNITVPQDSTYSFAIGTVIICTADNSSGMAGNIVPETTGGGGNTPSINNNSSSISIGWGLTLIKVAADSWIVI